MDFTRYGSTTNTQAVSFDQGLKDFMIGVYNNMAIGLSITGLVALFVSSSPALMQAIFGTPLAYLVMFAPLIMVFFISAKINSMAYSKAKTLFYVFSGIMGLSLSTIFIVYTGASITRVFFMTASVFGAMSIYGYTTKKDLTSFGSFAFMGLIGIIILSIINIFTQSSAMQFVISIAALVIFIGLTAYDTQKLKGIYYNLGGTSEQARKAGLMGALSLYMDFINIFIHLLHLIGDRR